MSFLELFYDLVYVVLIAEVAHALATGAVDIGGYVFLFAVVWTAWVNGSSYHELHGNNDIRTRVFTFIQMFCVAAMALFTHSALGEGSGGFALSYASFLLVMTFLWWRTGVHDPDHRPLSIPYIAIFLLVTLMFAGSIYVEAPWKFAIWALGVILTVLSPMSSIVVARLHPEVKEEMQRSTAPTHSLVERNDLFVIIVLGEVIVGVVQGVAGHHHLTPAILATGGLGMLVAVGLWWLYFDSVGGQKPRADRGTLLFWMFLHLPLTMGIAAIGASILNIVAQSEETLEPNVRWLLVGGIAIVILSNAFLSLVVDLTGPLQEIHKPARRTMFVLAIAVLGLGFTSLNAVPLLALAAIGLILPIYLGLRVWLIQKTEGRREEAI